jgi:hypothetical protein
MQNQTLSLVNAISDLRKQGYVKDFNLKEEDLDDDYVIDEVYRFDVMTDPADQSVLYAIHRKSTAEKGILVNGYGIYSDAVTNSKIEHAER